MCTQCLVNPFYYGEFAPGWFLMRARREEKDTMGVGEWGLVESNNPSIVFKTTPIYHIDSVKLDNSLESFSDELYADVATGHRLYKALENIKFSFTVKKQIVKQLCYSFNDKFYLYLADFIAKSNPTTDHDYFSNLDPTTKHNYSFDPKLEYIES